MIITDLGSKFGTFQVVDPFKLINKNALIQIGSLLFLEVEKISNFTGNMDGTQYKKFLHDF